MNEGSGKTKTIRVPDYIAKTIDELKEKYPHKSKVELAEKAFKMKNGNFAQTMEEIHQELETRLMPFFDEDEITIIQTSLTWICVKKSLDVNGDERKERLKKMKKMIDQTVTEFIEEIQDDKKR